MNRYKRYFLQVTFLLMGTFGSILKPASLEDEDRVMRADENHDGAKRKIEETWLLNGADDQREDPEDAKLRKTITEVFFELLQAGGISFGQNQATGNDEARAIGMVKMALRNRGVQEMVYAVVEQEEEKRKCCCCWVCHCFCGDGEVDIPVSRHQGANHFISMEELKE